MVSLYDTLRQGGLSKHLAWRAAFAVVPVPILLLTAALVLIFGTDCPAGKWSERHTLRATALSIAHGHHVVIDSDEEVLLRFKTHADKEKSKVETDVMIQELILEKKHEEKIPEEKQAEVLVHDEKLYTSEVDVAVNERLTWKTTLAILGNPLTWLPGLSYITSFGFELAVDANLSNILFSIYKSPTFGQTKAGYITSLYGLLNIWTRPSGGIIGDFVYSRYGVPGKKYWMLGVGFIQGLFAVGLGVYIDNALEGEKKPSLAIIIVLMIFLAIFNEQGCGANFALVPHCNPYSNGVMSGIVGSMGNVGGVIFAMVFRFQSSPLGKPFWICGIICMIINASLVVIPVPKM
jgi:NNP family nitrate/nitrite transporter-like MFS transporter